MWVTKYGKNHSAREGIKAVRWEERRETKGSKGIGRIVMVPSLHPRPEKIVVGALIEKVDTTKTKAVGKTVHYTALKRTRRTDENCGPFVFPLTVGGLEGETQWDLRERDWHHTPQDRSIMFTKSASPAVSLA